MANALTTNRVDDAVEAFARRAIANGRTFDQEVEQIIDANRKLTPVERVAVSQYFRSQHPELQPSLTLDEIREGLM